MVSASGFPFSLFAIRYSLLAIRLLLPGCAQSGTIAPIARAFCRFNIFAVCNMSRLFISHSSRNNDKAIAMRDWLAQNGWDDVFLDLDPHVGLAPGEYWRQALAAAAGRCQAVLCLISPEWNTSSWCLNEFLLAKQYGKYVFPIIVSDIDIRELAGEITANHQVVDLVHDPHGWERLKEGLRRAGLDPWGSWTRSTT